MYKKKYLYLLVILVLFLGVWGCNRQQTLEESYEILSAVEGEGEVVRTPFETEISAGDNVNFVASPAEGWGFSYWKKNGEIIVENICKKVKKLY